MLEKFNTILRDIFTHLTPQRFRHVHSTASGAFLSIILERASYRRVDDRFHIRTRVNEVIILTTALANQFWIVPVFGEILTDLRP